VSGRHAHHCHDHHGCAHALHGRCYYDYGHGCWCHHRDYERACVHDDGHGCVYAHAHVNVLCHLSVYACGRVRDYAHGYGRVYVHDRS